MTTFTRLASLLLLVAFLGCGTEDAADTEAAMADAMDQPLMFEGNFEGPLGLQLWSIRDHMNDDLAAALADTYNMGFREVELAGTHGHSPQAFRQMLNEAGLNATSMHTGYERFRDSLEVVLDEAEALGVEYVGLAWIPHEQGQPFTDAMARESAAHFNEWGAAAQERGLQFFYHVHGYEFRPNPDGTTPFDVMIAETNPENVAYEIDVYWVHHAGVDSAELMRQHPDRWVLMHIKDMKEDTPTPDYSGGTPAEAKVPVGTGQIDFPAVLAAAQEIGIKRYYIEDESTDPLGNIPLSTAFLETVTY